MTRSHISIEKRGLRMEDVIKFINKRKRDIILLSFSLTLMLLGLLHRHYTAPMIELGG